MSAQNKNIKLKTEKAYLPNWHSIENYLTLQANLKTNV